MNSPKVSIIIPTYKRNMDLFRLLKSILSADYPTSNLQIIVIDNGCDTSLRRKLIAKYPNTLLIEPGKNLYANGAFKLGTNYVKGKYVFLLDDDNILEPDCIKILTSALESDSNLGMVGPLMLVGDTDEILSVGARVTSFGIIRYLYWRKNLKNVHLPEIINGFDYLHNARMVRADILKTVNFDPETFPHNWAETDFSYQVNRAGYKLATMTSAVARHFGQYKGWITRIGPEKTYDQAKSRILFRRRYMSTPPVWIKFWVIVFPISSFIYFWQIMKSPQHRIQMLRAYIRGTRDGLILPLKKVYKP